MERNNSEFKTNFLRPCFGKANLYWLMKDFGLVRVSVCAYNRKNTSLIFEREKFSREESGNLFQYYYLENLM